MKKYKVLGQYLFLSFSIPLICILLQNVPFLQNSSLQLILFGIQAASPSIAAIAVWCLNGGRDELRNKLHKHYLSNLSLQTCILAFLLQFLLLTAAKAIVVCLQPEQVFFSALTLKKIIIISWALVAEELGWRGLLQEELELLLPQYYIPLCTGIIWALWHYHFFLGGSMDVPIVAFTFGCIFESYGYYTLVKLSKGNVIPACICHFTGNLFFNLYKFGPAYQNGSSHAYWITVIMYSLEIVLFLVIYKRNCSVT